MTQTVQNIGYCLECLQVSLTITIRNVNFCMATENLFLDFPGQKLQRRPRWMVKGKSQEETKILKFYRPVLDVDKGIKPPVAVL